jgi:hypothetical protein
MVFREKTEFSLRASSLLAEAPVVDWGDQARPWVPRSRSFFALAAYSQTRAEKYQVAEPAQVSFLAFRAVIAPIKAAQREEG